VTQAYLLLVIALLMVISRLYLRLVDARDWREHWRREAERLRCHLDAVLYDAPTPTEAE
jgi:hypothetical protein